MNKTRWLIFAGACVLLIGFLVFQGGASQVSFDGDPAKVATQDKVYGKKDAKVVLIEYGDFQCPGCGSLEPTVKQVREQYKDKIAFVFRNLPLTTIHPNAKAAATAAQAAAKQGKFWEMHDKLYANQSEWSSADGGSRSSFFERYAQEAGVNIDQYKKDIASSEVIDAVNRDVAAAKKAGFQLSTPTLVLNGRTLENQSITDGGEGNSQFSVKKLNDLIDAELKKNGETPPSASDAQPQSTPATTSTGESQP